jgi:hypothetical protein
MLARFLRLFSRHGGRLSFPTAAGFLAHLGSSGAVFAAIDIAVRPGAQFHHGLGGKFNAGGGFSSLGKSKLLSFGYRELETGI